MASHEAVLVAEAIGWLAPVQGGLFVDCTVGGGGHARALLEAGATRVVGIDRDEDALAAARETLAPWSDRVELVHADYRALNELLDERGLATIDGAIADLGVSSMQLDREGRGFSFRRDEPLDMRMDRSRGRSAADLLKDLSEAELADTIWRYGEDRYSRRIARALVEARRAIPVTSTGQLAAIVRRAMPRQRRMRIDPATRTFQALRILVNGELDGLDAFLVDAVHRLRKGARLVVISFHSLEDRIVKRTFRMLAHGDAQLARVLTPKPVVAGPGEGARNPRARSAKLRVVERWV